MSKVYFQEASFIKEILASIDHSELFVLVDENSKKYCYPILRNYLNDHQLIEIQSGEKNKTLDSCALIWNTLTEANADRKSVLINLGGGVITDMGGFCAGTYKRGIRFINIPTTLLSQVDASVGAKTGIDYQGYKNHIGLFCESEAVLVNTSFHQTLAERQMKSGFAEMLKHGLIADKQHWVACINNGFQKVPLDLIKQSVSIKEKVVKDDPNEKGLRKILNFGHTIGHAIETHFLGTENELLHGEAIALGMMAESYISRRKKLLNQADFENIITELRKIYKQPNIEQNSYNEIKRLCKQDKKNTAGKIKMSLLENNGSATFDIAVEDEYIEDALREIL